MLGSVFKHRGVDLASNKDLMDLIKSFKTYTLVKDNSVSWNLDVVRKWLTGPAFEPLHTISFKNLTRRRFLVALATAKRVSELQGVDKRIGFSKGDAVFTFVLGFLAKKESPSIPWPRLFSIKNLMDSLGPDEEERVLCPVRSLRYYLDRTERIRGPASNLWCSVKNPSKSLTKNALSFFLRSLIIEAHSQIEDDVLPSFKVKARY